MIPKVGLGYDVHRFAKGRKLYLGGLDIPYEMGLEGHSDADVLLHAICDAILGALGRGDIGEHFPDTNEQYRGISSLELLRKVYEFADKDGYSINNIDAIVVAQEPKLVKYKGKMENCIAEKLNMDDAHVNIKATTNEGLGFVGRKEGIAAYATVSIVGKK